MKFSEISREQWPDLHAYLDTAVIPLSGLTGAESPFEATEALERLQQALDPIEKAFKGRVVTYPAIHYAENDEQLAKLLDHLYEQLREAGFRFVIAVGGHSRLKGLELESDCLLLVPADPSEAAAYRAEALRSIESLWQTQTAET